MSKNIPRKIKKACKNITLVYGNDEAWSLIDNIPKYRRNTKWNRKAISFTKCEEKLKLKHIERGTKFIHGKKNMNRVNKPNND